MRSNGSIKEISKERTHFCVGWTDEEVIRFKFNDIRTSKGSVLCVLKLDYCLLMVLTVRLGYLSLFLRMQEQIFFVAL